MVPIEALSPPTYGFSAALEDGALLVQGAQSVHAAGRWTVLAGLGARAAWAPDAGLSLIKVCRPQQNRQQLAARACRTLQASEAKVSSVM